MSKVIIGLVGPLASGKSVTKKYLIEKYKAQDCRFSTVLRDVLNRISIPISHESLQKISTVLRISFGEDLFAKIIANDVGKFGDGIVVVDGVRRPIDIEYLKKLPNFFLVKIDAGSHTRHERLVKRNENEGDNKKSFEQFLKDHESEADGLVPMVMAEAQFSIYNNGTFDELYYQIDKIMGEILKNIK
jgi:dephospho-CoA kinase